MTLIVTIDGPSGSGKGTISRLVAEKTGFALLDSGALYRLTALASINAGVDIEDEAAVTAQAKALDVVFTVETGRTIIQLQGADVTQAIRQENVGMVASKVAAYPKVREALLDRQRNFACPPGLVADGRDMGTVVFPDAGVKVFLTASAEERARRRVEQLQVSGQKADYDRVLSDIVARDEKDSSRSAAPLKPADSAIVVDSTALSINQVYDLVMSEIEKQSSGNVSC